MRLNAKQMRMVSKITADYRSIYCDKDLETRKLSLSDYNAIPEIIRELQQKGTAVTFIEDLANYCKTMGLEVKSKGVNFIIKL